MLKAGKEMDGFRFKCLRSVAPIVNKRFDVQYVAVETDVTDYCEHVRQGHAHLAYCEGGRKEANYVYDHVICIDLDKVDYDMQTAYNKASDKPNFIHATPSDGKDGKHSFHLLYFFDDSLTKEEKRAHAQVLREPFGADADAHLDQPVQVVGGMKVSQDEDLSNEQMYGCAYLYSKDTSLVTAHAESLARRPIVQKRENKLWLTNEKYDGYYDKYHCHKNKPNEGKLHPLIETKTNARGERVRVKKVLHDGERRRRMLFKIGVNVRILSGNTISQADLEWNLRWWAGQYCDSGNGLDDKWISRAAAYILSLDFDSLQLSDDARRYSHSFDMPAIRAEGTKWQRCLAMKRYAEADPEILRFLKPHLHKTIAEMLVIANDAGIEMSERTLKTLLKRNGNPHRAAKMRYQSLCAEEKKRKRRRPAELSAAHLMTAPIPPEECTKKCKDAHIYRI